MAVVLTALQFPTFFASVPFLTPLFLCHPHSDWVKIPAPCADIRRARLADLREEIPVARSRFVVTTITLLTCLVAGRASALETDQYTPPPAPLVDIAPQVQQKVRAVLQEVASETNIEYLRRDRLAKGNGWGRDGHAAEAARLQAEDAVAAAFYEKVGPGTWESTLEAWITHSRFPQEPAVFAPTMDESIYGANPFAKPVTLVLLSPTVNLFGVYVGTDKVGHFTAQGYEYYQVFRKAETAGEDPAKATARAIDHGRTEENTYYGMLTVGVYSNADMAANYAGMKFYLNLTRPVVINGVRLPPLLVKREDLWEINPELPADFLRPYFTEHLNEAMNPNLYTGVLADTVRARFAARADKWMAFYGSTRDAEAVRARTMTTYFGEPYGHSGTDGVLGVADLIPDQRRVAAHGAGARGQ